jgi:hypothetical protein
MVNAAKAYSYPWTLVSMTLGLFKMVAVMIAPCSVKASGSLRHVGQYRNGMNWLTYLWSLRKGGIRAELWSKTLLRESECWHFWV